ncbi:MAG: 2Fe-2S iron-sulfur cluster-binding protein [Lentisphaeria bacterium]
MIVNTIIFTIFILFLYLLIEIISYVFTPERDVELDLGDLKILGKSGESVLGVLLQNEIMLPGSCGGKGSCGLCRCKIESSKVVATEAAILSKEEQAKGVRLACQHYLYEGFREVQLAKEVLNAVSMEVEILGIEKLCSTLYEFSFKRPNGFHFEAGNYLVVKVPSYEITIFGKVIKNFELLMRAYSISSGESSDRLKIIVALVYDNLLGEAIGLGSSWLFSRVVGDKVEIVGPYGDFGLQKTSKRKCFIAGGAGIAPVLSILESNDQLEAELWFGTRRESYEAYRGLLEGLRGKNGNFSYRIAVSDDEFTCQMVDEYFLGEYLKKPEDISDVEFYLCGPGKMIESTLVMLDKVGADRRSIFYDNFG